MTNMPIRNCMTRSFMTILACAVPMAIGRAFCASSRSRSPASPRTNWRTRGSGWSFEALGGTVVEDLRLAGGEPGQRVEHDHAVGDLGDGLHVVGHDDAGGLLGPLRLEDQLVDHVAHDRVEPGGRLVVEHDLGVERQRPGQADALPLAAGELGGLLLLEAFGQADLLEAIGDKPGRAPHRRRACARGGRTPRCRRSSGCRTAPPSGTGSRTGAGSGSARAR